MKKISFEMTDKQYAAYEKAAEQLLSIGIPTNPKNIIQMLAAGKNANDVSNDFLSLMRSLVNQGKKQLRNTEFGK